MTALQRINFLIDQHVEIPYSVCPGCKHCEEIKKISKESGLWLGDATSRKSVEGRKRMQNFTKDKLKCYLDKGVPIKEISRREKFNEITIRRKIQKWFPDYFKQKKSDLIPFDKFIDLKKQGLMNIQIAELENVPYQKLTYQVQKWRRQGKLTDEAI